MHKRAAVMKTHHANTYDLILASESEDRGRAVIETLIYAAFILSAVLSILHIAMQPVVVPSRIAARTCQIEYCA